MKKIEFSQFLIKFLGQPQPAIIQRHVYLWQSSLESLLEVSPKGLYHVLDLHSLCKSIDKTPSSVTAARRILSEAIQLWIDQNYKTAHSQKALAIIGIDMLVRYQVPLGIFFQLANETSLVTFVVPASLHTFHPIKPLPNYIKFEPNQLFSYIKAQIPEDAVIGEE